MDTLFYLLLEDLFNETFVDKVYYSTQVNESSDMHLFTINSQCSWNL